MRQRVRRWEWVGELYLVEGHDNDLEQAGFRDEAMSKVGRRSRALPPAKFSVIAWFSSRASSRRRRCDADTTMLTNRSCHKEHSLIRWVGSLWVPSRRLGSDGD